MPTLQTASQTFATLSALQVMVLGVAFFGGIYLLFGSAVWLLTRHVLPACNIGRVLDPRPVTMAQLRREFAWSAVSIVIFGAGLLLPWGLLQAGWVQLYPDASAIRIVLEITALMLWNEVHFWCNHRLLHTRWLMRFHRAHHRSIVTTPFATYAFHPVEAAMLGSVSVLPMFVHDFSIWSLLGLSLASLWINGMGHSNYDFFPHLPHTHWLVGSRRHHLHHACFRGNYGFQFGFMDRLFGSRLHEKAAEPQIQRYLAQASAANPASSKGQQ